MSSYHDYNRNGAYFENMNRYDEQNKNRYNEGKGDIDREKLEYYQIQKQLELEKEKQNLPQKQQFEEYPNYSNQRSLGLYEDRNNIKFEGEDRDKDRRMNYYNQMACSKSTCIKGNRVTMSSSTVKQVTIRFSIGIYFTHHRRNITISKISKFE